MNQNNISPRWIYHATSKKNLRKIITEGLKPRRQTGGGNWKGQLQSHPEMVYLTAGNTLYYGVEVKADAIGVIRINLNQLDQAKLYPDEDYLAVPSPLLCGVLPKEEVSRRVESARSQMLDHQARWHDSLTTHGTCCHRGNIPPTAIDKAIIISKKPKFGSNVLTLIFGHAYEGRVNCSYYQKAKPGLDCINSFLFNEPYDLDAWINSYDWKPGCDPTSGLLRKQVDEELVQLQKQIRVVKLPTPNIGVVSEKSHNTAGETLRLSGLVSL